MGPIRETKEQVCARRSVEGKVVLTCLVFQRMQYGTGLARDPQGRTYRPVGYPTPPVLFQSPHSETGWTIAREWINMINSCFTFVFIALSCCR